MFELITIMFLSNTSSLIFSIFLVLVLLGSVASEQFATGYICVVLYTILLAGISKHNVFSWAWNNPLELLSYGIEYLAIGAIFSVLKYKSFVSQTTTEVSEIKRKFIVAKELTISVTDQIPEENKEDWKKYFTRHASTKVARRVHRGLRSMDNKSRIFNWIMFFPVVIVEYFFAEQIMAVLHWIHKSLRGIYNKIYSVIVSKNIHISDIEN